VAGFHAGAPPARSVVPHGIVDLLSGNPDPDLLPSLGAALRTIPAVPAMYGVTPDLPALVTFAKAEFAADGRRVSDVMVTGGALDAIDRILREHLRPGDRVALEDPVVPPLLDLLTASGFAPDPMAIDEHGPTPAVMEKALGRRPSAVIVTPRGQNPTGACLTQGRAAELRAILKQHPAPLLIENDPLGPVAGVPAVSLTDARTRWAIVRSTAKFLGPDLRVAVVAGDELTLARVRRRQAVGTRWVSHLLQRLVLALWSDPAAGRQLARAADAYTRRREALVGALAAHRIGVNAPSGFNVWIPVRHESLVVEQMAERGWAVAAGERFRIASGPAIRVTTSALEPDAARRFAEDLAAVMRAGTPVLA
jgi:DNA-binding transcriptional MocR family regulator